MGFPFLFNNSKKNRKNKGSSISRSSSSLSSSSSSSDVASPRSVLHSRGHDGRVHRHDLAAALRRLDPTSNAAELDSILSEADRHGDGHVRIEDVCAGNGEEEVRAAFAVYDVDGDGRISAEDLHVVMARVGDEGCSLKDCRRMVAVVDGDGDGFVGFADFATMMMTATTRRPYPDPLRP